MEISYFLSSECNFHVCFLELLRTAAKSGAYKNWRRAKGYNLMRISFDYLNFCYKSSRQGWSNVFLFFVTLVKMNKSLS